MAEKTLLLILNPVAGTRQARKYLPEIIALFARYGWQNLVFVTERRGDAARFVAEHGKKVSLVVCIGGDGTFNETVSGLLRVGLELPVGYIPAGSTNDFANSLRLPSDAMAAAENIMEGRPVRLDLGRFADRHFSYVASFGAFTRASYATPQSVKNALGHLAYLLEGVKDLRNLRPARVRLLADESACEGEYLFGAVSNSTSLGGVLTLAPEEVRLDDGMFEIMLIRTPRSPAELQTILNALATKQYRCGMIDFIHTARAEVFADRAMDWSLDGEHAPGGPHIVIENLHGALCLLTRGM